MRISYYVIITVLFLILLEYDKTNHQKILLTNDVIWYKNWNWYIFHEKRDVEICHTTFKIGKIFILYFKWYKIKEPNFFWNIQNKFFAHI